MKWQKNFISTHTPLTGCNRVSTSGTTGSFNFYSHTPHGVQRNKYFISFYPNNFYSHTPHGVQHWNISWRNFINIFLLTHPSRGATVAGFVTLWNKSDFYSHTPHGVQHANNSMQDGNIPFLLTHPSRGATWNF